MKINLGTTSDVSNVKTGLKLDGKSDKDNGENESFFSKLASFFSGENDSKSQVTTTKNGAAVKAESGMKGESVEKNLVDSDSQTQNQETEEGLGLVADSVDSADVATGGGDQQAELNPEALKPQINAKNSDSEEIISKSAKAAISSSANNASQVMDEGKDVLHRLQEANATLSSGKALPQKDSELVGDGSVKNLIVEAQTPKSDVGSNVLTEIDKQVSADVVNGKVTADVKGNGDALVFAQSPVQALQKTRPDDQNSVQFVDDAVSGPTASSSGDEARMAKLLSEDEITPEDAAALNDSMPSDYKIAAQNLQVQGAIPSDSDGVAGNPLVTEADLSKMAGLSPQMLEKMATADGQFSQHKQVSSEQPTLEQAMMFAPGVAAGIMNENNQSASMMYVDTDGQVIDLDKLNKAELEQLAHKHGKTVPQLLSGAVQMNVNQHQQSHVLSMQSPDKQGVESLNLSTNQAANAAINNAAMSETAALMTKDMTKSFEQRNGFDFDRHLDVRNIDGDSIGKDSHIAHQASAMNGLNSHSFSQIARAESAQASQAPVQVNKDNASEQLAERVNMMLSKNLKNIDIRLDPPDLGKVHIRMHMNGDATSVQFTVANHHAREALENSMPRLREMLSQQGVQVGDTAVQHQSSQQQNGYAASGRGQEQSGQSQNTNSASASGFGEENNESDVTLRVNVPSPQDGISYYA